MLGKCLLSLIGEQAVGLRREVCDLLQAEVTAPIAAAHSEAPLAAVFNAAAFTAVDAAESYAHDALLRVNAAAPAAIARWCAEAGVPFVHFSSDYVLPGHGTTPQDEATPPAPLNAYGRSKLAGEQAIRDSGGQHLILRTSWLYAAHGRNFFLTMQKLLREKPKVSVVNDQFGAPTYAPHLAAAALRAVEAARRKPAFPSGIYHLANAGETTWHGFASAILDEMLARGERPACTQIAAIRSEAFGAAAQRPFNSRLDCGKIRRELDIWLPPWETGLRECVELASGV